MFSIFFTQFTGWQKHPCVGQKGRRGSRGRPASWRAEDVADSATKTAKSLYGHWSVFHSPNEKRSTAVIIPPHTLQDRYERSHSSAVFKVAVGCCFVGLFVLGMRVARKEWVWKWLTDGSNSQQSKLWFLKTVWFKQNVIPDTLKIQWIIGCSSSSF